MSFDRDPYRTLGLPRGASLDEVKRAYRQLAKQFHPDSAGERALPRFLAIQSAYEQLAGPARGTGFRPAPRPADARSAPPRRPPAGPTWEADPARARATRDAYRRNRPGGARGGAGEGAAGRPPGGSTGRSGGGPTTGASGTTGSGAAASWTGTRPGRRADAGGSTETGRAGRPTGGGSTSGERPTGGGAGDRGPRRRPSRKATLGSTSYDEAGAQFEATWEGGTWYGASSGTYWTINPKEYADPRKHGPEYLARARRARGQDVGLDPGVESAAGAAMDDEREAAGDRADDRPGVQQAFATGEQAADAVGHDAPAGRIRRNARRRSPDSPARAASSAPRASGTQSVAAAPKAGGVEAHAPVPPIGTVGQRALFALVGWPPIGLAIAGVYGELTGCGRFAATCTRPDDGPFGLAMWLVQLAVLAALLAVPRAARAATAGTAGLLAAAIPSAVLLSAIGGARDPQTAASALVAMLGAAWLVGVALDASGRFAPLAVRWGRVR